MSPERGGFEPEPQPGEKAFENLVAHLERVGHVVSRENLRQLIGTVRVEDLTNSPLTERIGEVPLATIRGRELTLDQRFEQFTPEQQLHVMAHEYGHTLSWFMASQEDSGRFQDVARLINQLPTNQVSYYVDHLQKKLPNDESSAAFLENERIAEVFAQYLESDRTFSGFITAKLLEFPRGDADLTDEERAEYQKIADQVGELQGYLEMADNEAEREAFLSHHSELAPHYQLWRELSTLFEETDFADIDQLEDEDFEEYEAWELMELANQLHPEPPRVDANRPPKTALGAQATQGDEPKPSSFFGDLITFWKVFTEPK